jgi:pimeloyl-ACP methyl ester carboxylesterase
MGETRSVKRPRLIPTPGGETVKTVEYRIPAGEETLACSVDYAGGEPAPSVICLHGGGPSGRHSTKYLGEALQARGRSVVRFDFSGHGDSTGVIAESSLKKRFQEARAVLDYFGLGDGISVIGTSMGGHIACALASEVSVETLVFFGPAAYSARAWDVPFGSGFTDIIREEGSFQGSDIVDLLRGFAGRALHAIGERDEIIPAPVTNLYKEALSHCRVFDSYTIAGCPHPIHRWLQNHPDVRKEVVDKVVGSVCV